MSNKETDTIELTHEYIVEQLKVMQQNTEAISSEGEQLKAHFKELRKAFNGKQRTVAKDVYKVSLLISQGISSGITTNSKLVQDSGVHKTTVSRYNWLGDTLSRVGVSKSAISCVNKSLNLLSQGKLNKGQLETVQTVEDWKQLISDASFTIKGVSTDKICNSILSGFNDADIQQIASSLEQRMSQIS